MILNSIRMVYGSSYKTQPDTLFHCEEPEPKENQLR